ncbi:hypothetical protein Y032_0033g2736 [Ancylostoma ceylanicum]|uniref:Uncharacterized protein n=1 Tax=Ancylostoma ceylanicum TaxID=53326 RepID=A0A016UQ45_9BILA|nr:hypothetical protein Y032_0033g2736 [Ancylostoma ceylanicum]
MPGIFSWKNRILGRKTPEPERAVQVTVLREPVDRDLHNHTPRRSVRFNDSRNEFSQYNVPEWQNDYGEARVIGSVSPANLSGQFRLGVLLVKPYLSVFLSFSVPTVSLQK